MKNLILIPILLLLAGCLTFEQTVRLNKDGSVLASYVYTYQSIYEEAIKIGLSKSMPANGAESSHLDFLNEKSMETFCTRNGLELRQYKKTVKGDKTTVQIIVLARRGTPNELIALGGFVRTDKRMEIILPEITWHDTMKATIEKLCPGLALSLTVIAPENITATNGNKIRQDTVSWIITPDSTLFNGKEKLFLQWQ